MIQQGDMEDRHRKVGKRTDEITQKIGGLVELREGRFRDGMFRPCIYHHHLHSSSQVWWEVSLVSPNPQSELANSQCACRAHTLELTTLRGTQILFLVLIILCVSGLILWPSSPTRLSATWGHVWYPHCCILYAKARIWIILDLNKDIWWMNWSRDREMGGGGGKGVKA